jgi:hypothetical protein
MTKSQADKSLARITLTREHLRFLDDYEAVHEKSLIMMADSGLIPDMDAPGILELRPSGKKGSDGKFIVAERWNTPTFLKDMAALFADLKPVGIEIAEAYSQPLLLLRFDGLAVNDAVQRARASDLHVDYRTPPSTVTGFLEVTAKSVGNNMKVHPVRVKAQAQLQTRLGCEIRYGIETSGPGYYRVSVTLARQTTQEHTFCEEVGGCTVRFTLDGEVQKKKEEDRAVEALVKTTLQGVQTVLEDSLLVKRDRALDARDSEAVRRSTERAVADANMNGCSAAAGAASAAAVAVSDDDDDEIAERTAEKKAEASRKVDVVKRSIRDVLQTFARCSSNPETMNSCSQLLIGVTPREDERLAKFAEVISKVTSPGQLTSVLQSNGFPVPSHLKLSWSTLLQQPPNPVSVKALNAPRQSYTRQSRPGQPTQAPRKSAQSSGPKKRTASVAQHRDGRARGDGDKGDVFHGGWR